MALIPTILRRSLSISRASISAIRLIGGDSHLNCNCHSCSGRHLNCNCHSCTSKALKKSHLYKDSIVPSSLVRHFSASPALTRPSHDESLVKIIDQEIDFAVESLEESEVQEAPEGFPFKIEDNPGQQTISLSADFDGENINVEVSMPIITADEDNNDKDSDADNDTDEDKRESSMSLVVRLSKSSGLVLEFGCTAYPDEISIDTLSVKDPDNVEDPVAYEGPDFSDLDENLQKSFHKYLEIRGIKPSMTNHLYEYMLNKDSKEYLVWLKNLKEFIQA
ncbi:Mitochondrial glycoprotein [Heracleum sosnowskyi]|uniref:Mitochondrial glycoprotein n=1 Tax=Heracleum sosnowskyi TaxID=360622 RepID=A0AAD8GWF5_9APIA|nr:Mitochondrial glycoprotein [Heracleum sosnowskyi]